MNAKDGIALLRPRQWYKNLLLFVGLVFSLHLREPAYDVLAFEGFLVFCALTSGVYALNDTIDATQDRLHPKKRERPVAAGRISPPVAVGVSVVLVGTGLGVAWWLNTAFFLATLAYVLLQVAYLLVLKHQVFLDLFTIASGLVLRAIAGVVLIGVGLSPWLLLCTFFLALFLGLGKRRNEIRVLGPDASAHRKNLSAYSPALLEQATTIVTSALVVCYSLYTFFHDERRYLMATIPFALYGLFRYLYLVSEKNLGGEPEVIFRDRASIITFLLWGALVVGALYLAPGGAP